MSLRLQGQSFYNRQGVITDPVAIYSAMEVALGEIFTGVFTVRSWSSAMLQI